ncbi:hybrid sensor histidine kinase/response regulator, partial [bacterium]|nr:hybrid sensor histidine kinase/response regulator [bacterium]
VKLNLKQHQINESVQEVVELVQQTLDPGIALKVNLHDDLPLVMADAAQLHSVLMNVCMNSIDAIHEKQKQPGSDKTQYEIQFITKQEYRSEHNKQFCLIEITDNGVGMKPDVIEHIFEPFFTTKGANGTGLGLASAFGVLQGHKGWIECKSRNGDGATFRIYIPSAE